MQLQSHEETVPPKFIKSFMLSVLCPSMTYKLIIFTTFVLLLGIFLQAGNTELRVELVQVLFRHGDRTPRQKEMWPNDPHNESIYEPWGLGQMTNEGKKRVYRIGQMLRERYNKFLGEIYYPADVYGLSTDHDRTKMSLQLVLAGLYQPAPQQMWNENLNWMPLPINYMPEKVDNLMKPDLSPIYAEALAKVRNSKEVHDKVLEYKDFFQFLSEKTGINITQLNQVYEIYNLLIAQKTMNLTLPSWCTDDNYQRIEQIVKLEYEIRSFTPQLRRMNGGWLVKRFIENIKVNEERDKKRKIYLYSGHEVNIAAFIRAHNFTEPTIPSYGSAIIFEKLTNETGKNFIRILHWTGVTEELIPYRLHESSEVCPMDDYLKIIQDVIPSEEETDHMWNFLSKEDLRKLYEETFNLN